MKQEIKNQYYKAPKNVEHIKTKKVKLEVHLKTVFYIKLVAKKQGKRIQYHAETITKRAKVGILIFKTKKSFITDKIISKVGANFKIVINKTINVIKETYSKVRDSFQTSILKAENNLKLASLRHYDTAQRFPFMVELCKAKNALRSFKYSLPRNIRFQLF